MRDKTDLRGKTKALAEAGKLTALTVVISLFYFYFPLFTFLTLPICPIPIVLLTSRYGSKYGLLASLATGIILFPLISIIPALSVFFFISFLGVLMGLAIKKEFSGLKVISVGVVAVVLSTLALIVIAYFILGINFVAEQVKIYEEALHLQRGVYARLGANKAELEKLVKDLEAMIKIIPYLMPALVVISSCWTSLVCFFGSYLVMRRLKLKTPSFPRFKEFDLPWYFSWAFLFGMASVLFSRYIASNLYFVGLNFFVVAVFLFFIQGIAVLSHYFEEHKLSKSVKILLYCLAIFIQLVFLGVSFLGLLDTWLNYRKLSRS